MAAEEVDCVARERTRGRFAVRAIYAKDEPEEPLREGYKALDYRLGRTELFIIHRIRRISVRSCWNTWS